MIIDDGERLHYLDDRPTVSPKYCYDFDITLPGVFIDLTDEEMDYLEKTVNQVPCKETWAKAFRIHNQYNLKKMGMGCRPCYAKVLAFCKKYHRSKREITKQAYREELKNVMTQQHDSIH